MFFQFVGIAHQEAHGRQGAKKSIIFSVHIPCLTLYNLFGISINKAKSATMSIDRHQTSTWSALRIRKQPEGLQGVGIGHDAHRPASGKQLVGIMIIRKKDGGTWSALRIRPAHGRPSWVGIGHDAHRPASGSSWSAMLIRKKDGGTWSAFMGRCRHCSSWNITKAFKESASAMMRIDIGNTTS